VATETKPTAYSGTTRRRAERFELHTPLDVTVLRSGVPDTLPGRTVNVGERGIGAVLAGELLLGETVGIEVHLPHLADPLRARGTVRYQDKLFCGIEFTGLSEEQREAIRACGKGAKAFVAVAADLAGGKLETSLETSAEKSTAAQPVIQLANPVTAREAVQFWRRVSPKKSRKKQYAVAASVLLGFALILGSAVWWRWNRGWQELESGLSGDSTSGAERPRQVSAEAMEKLLVHRVEPTYPAEARNAKLQGVIALDIVIGRDGSVASIRPLNGPAVLARAAIDALRWWKFEPYRVNGEPTVVETTVAVEFKP
jgi:TonB family protein